MLTSVGGWYAVGDHNTPFASVKYTRNFSKTLQSMRSLGIAYVAPSRPPASTAWDFPLFEPS